MYLKYTSELPMATTYDIMLLYVLTVKHLVLCQQLNLYWTRNSFYLSEIKMNSTNRVEQSYILPHFYLQTISPHDCKTLQFWGQIVALTSEVFLLITKGLLL